MDGQITHSKMTGRPGSQVIAGLSNGELRPGARFPHLKDLIARVHAQTLGFVPATPVCILHLMYYSGEKNLMRPCAPTLDQHTFTPGGGISNSRRCERHLQETRACVCGLYDQHRDPVEHNSSSSGVRIISRKQREA